MKYVALHKNIFEMMKPKKEEKSRLKRHRIKKWK